VRRYDGHERHDGDVVRADPKNLGTVEAEAVGVAHELLDGVEGCRPDQSRSRRRRDCPFGGACAFPVVVCQPHQHVGSEAGGLDIDRHDAGAELLDRFLASSALDQLYWSPGYTYDGRVLAALETVLARRGLLRSRV
jgi:hypothetical protein